MRKVSKVVWDFSTSHFSIKRGDGGALTQFEETMLWKTFWSLKKIMRAGDVQMIILPELQQRIIFQRWSHLTYYFTLEDLEN